MILNGPNQEWSVGLPESLYDFLCGKEGMGYCIGFNGSPNKQSAHLTSQLKWITDDNYVYLNSCEYTFSELLNIIKKQKITLSTFENRNYLLDSLENKINSFSSKKISLNRQIHTIPDWLSPEGVVKKDFIYSKKIKSIVLPQDLVEELKALNDLDYKLYNYIKEHELKNKRSLSYKDIN